MDKILNAIGSIFENRLTIIYIILLLIRIFYKFIVMESVNSFSPQVLVTVTVEELLWFDPKSESWQCLDTEWIDGVRIFLSLIKPMLETWDIISARLANKELQSIVNLQLNTDTSNQWIERRIRTETLYFRIELAIISREFIKRQLEDRQTWTRVMTLTWKIPTLTQEIMTIPLSNT